MNVYEAREEYLRAQKMGLKEHKERLSRGLDPEPAVLDEILKDSPMLSAVNVGLVDVPAGRIVGTKSAGRTGAFTAGFLPILGADSEFAIKWINLCAAHLSDEGIRDPVVCFEYLGNFYVQEGNKRVSVLRYFGAPRIPCMVTRLMPEPSEDPRIVTYFEFLEFYQVSRIYDVQFRKPGDYAKLLSYLGKDPAQEWDEREQKTFRAYYTYFKEAFDSLQGYRLDLLPEEGLLIWLRVHPFHDLGQLSSMELKKTMSALWENLVAAAQDEPVQVLTQPEPEEKGGILSKLLPVGLDHIHVAFVHPRDLSTSPWVTGHEEGAAHLQRVLGERVVVRSYFHADTREQAEQILEEAVADGAQVVFTTTPQLSRATLKAAVGHPKVRFFNCSVDAPYSSVRAYYSRVFEGKFITGAIAGAMSDNNCIGYVGSYPIFGVPASINAFALGAQLTNPRARIDLRWSCMAGQPVKEFMEKGIKVISNRDVPTPNKMYLDYCDYGTYMVCEDGSLKPLGSPCWMWGKFYERVIRALLKNGLDYGRDSVQAVNYWWGMDSGVIDVSLPDSLPEGVFYMARMLRQGLRKGAVDPFNRRIIAQDGTVKNPGHRGFTPEELLHMDWLVENVEGHIPTFEEVQPFAQAMVRELGIYRDAIPMEKEGQL